MEEEIIDFDQWIADYTPKPPTYAATFDPETGAVKSVGPSFAFDKESYKIDIDSEIAEAILTGEMSIHKCVVDLDSNKLEIAEIQSVVKIDDLLHRISNIKLAKFKKPNVFLTHHKEEKILKIELSEEFGGVRKLDVETRKRKIIWDGDTEMVFLITEYNDPNMIFETISVKLDTLVGSSAIFRNFEYENFSIYTRRLFNEYVFESK